jgi:uncharacterized protein
MLSVASLHVYPIKSVGGFSVEEARITDRGFEHDRRLMLVNEQGRFISQREIPAMACLHTSPVERGFRVTDVRDGDHLELSWTLSGGDTQHATVWDDPVEVISASPACSDWFARKLNVPITLVHMPDKSHRSVDPRYAQGITSLSDGFPYLIISQASLDDLNTRIRSSSDHLIDRSSDLSMDRFRPNIVVAGGEAHQEDRWKEIAVGDARLSLVKPCARCMITTIDQRTGDHGKEPLRTLATYRKRTVEGKVKVDFGMNAMVLTGKHIRVGTEVQVIR